METELYKIRSVRSCIRAASDLFITNLRTIVRKTWLPALVLSAILSISVFLDSPFNSSVITSRADALLFLRQLISMVVLAILSIAAFAWLNTSVVSLLNGRSFKKNLPRVARQSVLLVVVLLALGAIITAVSFIPFSQAEGTKSGITAHTLELSGAITLTLLLVFALALIPMAFSTMKYFMEPDRKVLSIVGRSYARGWRSWGFLFTITLLAGIISALLYVVIQSPSGIITMAQQQDAAGAVMGDETGLPGYFPVLAYVTALLCSFVWSYVLIWLEMSYYYAYGSMEARDKEKQSLTTQA